MVASPSSEEFTPSLRVMNNRKLLCILFFVIFVSILLVHRNFKSSPLVLTPSRIKLFSDCSKTVVQTCLQSYDAQRLHKSVFHISMVHFKYPDTLNFWIENKTGFEIGAPSPTSWGTLGVYDAVKTLDTSNYAANTLWEGGIKDGSPFIWKNQTKGKQYIREGVDLHGVPSDFYDFVCASDVLEHIANPFKALLEWIRILRPGGLLIIIVPFKNVTFDHKRDVVRIEHLIDDYYNQTNETDLSHLNEILRLHDLGKDFAAGGPVLFKARSEKNFENRGLHQHVYDHELLYYIYLCLNLDVKIQYIWDYRNLIIGQKQ